MCGIAGLVSPNQSTGELQQSATAMANAIEHRGPDALGVWVEESQSLAFSHRRLAIQDLSDSGAQPMASHGGRYTIAFNGEIYNFQKVRAELGNRFQFRGHSDTEVLLCAIETWGIDETLKKIKGMFAIALWDSEQSTLTLIRDRIGEKPLYYGVLDGALVFGSELKAIFAHTPASHLEINKQALASFLRHGYISAPNSIFTQIKKLPPGHRIDVRLQKALSLSFDQLKPTPFWSVQDAASQSEYRYTQANRANAVTELDSKLNEIIQEQSIADVPLGAFLSGGIDSTVVSAILQANTSKPIDTFTIGFHEKSFNEAEFAKEIAGHIGSQHHEHYVGQADILELVEALPKVYDEPFADASQLPTILVNRFAKTELTVCLSGDGGDELFAGYNRYVFTEGVLKKAQTLPKPLRAVLKAMITALAPGQWDKLYQMLNSLAKRKGGAEFGNKLYKMVALADTNNKKEAYEFLMSYWQRPEQVLKQFDGEPDMGSPLDLEDDFINAAMAWDQQWYLPGDNLTKTDRASMAASLELRAPLLDTDLIEFAWTVSPELKVKDGKSKWLLREVLYKYVPQNLIERPKMGFSVPISQWIREDLSEWVDQHLSQEFIESQGLFRYEPIARALAEHRSNLYDHGKRLWTLLMFQAWYKTHIAQG